MLGKMLKLIGVICLFIIEMLLVLYFYIAFICNGELSNFIISTPYINIPFYTLIIINGYLVYLIFRKKK